MNLYEISNEYLTAFNHMSELVVEGDLPQDVFDHTMESLKGEMKEKCINIAAYFKNLEHLEKGLTEAENDIKAKKAGVKKHAERLRTYLKDNMEHCEIREINSPYFDLKIKKNPEAVEIIDAGQISKEFITTKEVTSPDKTAIKNAINNGVEIPGARLIASTRLEIK